MSAPAPSAPPAPSPDAVSAPASPALARLAALGIADQLSTGENDFARVLVLGPPKVGKTTCIVGTAPRPLVINCDGRSATKGARLQGAEFHVVDAVNRATWVKAVKTACTAVREGLVRTVVVDTITLLADNIVDDASVTLSGFDMWNDVKAKLVGGLKQLMQLDAHVFVIGHMTAGHDTEPGIMPMIGGQAKTLIPALIDDWVLLDFLEGRKPHERQFLLGPQGKWTSGGRNIKRSCQVEATVPALLAELGIEP